MTTNLTDTLASGHVPVDWLDGHVPSFGGSTIRRCQRPRVVAGAVRRVSPEALSALLATAFRDVAAQPEGIGATRRPDLGADLLAWHFQLSRNHVPDTVGRVHRPRHFLVYRHVDTVVEIVRVLHDSMELSRHLEDEQLG